MSVTATFAEEAVIGGLLLDNMRFHDIASVVAEDHFTSPIRKKLFAAIKSRVLAGEPADAVTIGEADADLFNDALDLASNTPSAAQVPAYANIVRNNWRRREVVQIALELSAGARAGEDDAVDSAIGRLLSLNSSVTDCEYTGKQAMKLAWDAISFAHANSGKLPGIPTGLTELDDILGGWQNSDLTLIGGRPAMGKEQPNSSKILMSDGKWSRMGDMRVGDKLASVDGVASEVTGVFPQGIKDVYQFEFSDGRTARAGIDHLWEVSYREWSLPRVLTTAQILKKLESERYKNRLSVRLISGNFGGGSDLPLDPWLLGFLLGDGNFTATTPRFATADNNVIDRVRAMIPSGYSISQCGKYDYRISGTKRRPNWLKCILDDMGLWGKYAHEKRIPSAYMQASRADRLELLRGLIDSDGWVETFNCIRFAASSIEFSSDVQDLARSLGALCSIRRKATTHRDSYVLTIRGAGQTEFSWLNRKASRIREPKHELALTIKGVELVGKEECTCIRVSHPTSLYVTDNYVVTHNTAFIGGLVEAAAESGFKPGFFSAEQPAVQMALRRVSLLSRVAASKLRNGSFDDEDWPMLTAGVQKANERDLMIYDRSAITLDELVGVSRKWVHSHGVKIIFIDYAQRITVPGADRIQEVASIARGLKNLARDLEVPVVALAQVVKGVDSRTGDKRPNAGDLANSDELTREADQILMLYRDEVYNPDSPDRGLAEILIEKNRHGPTGFKKVRFEAETMAFQSLARERDF